MALFRAVKWLDLAGVSGGGGEAEAENRTLCNTGASEFICRWKEQLRGAMRSREWSQETSRHCSQQNSVKTSESGKKVTHKFPEKLDGRTYQRNMHFTLFHSCRAENRAGVSHAGQVLWH